MNTPGRLTIGQQILIKLLKKFPEAPTKTLGNIAFRENPEVFMSAETARSSLRRLRNACGKDDPCKSTTEFYRPKGKPGDPFLRLPKPQDRIWTWKPLLIAGPQKMLILSDIHLPFHDEDALRVALKYGKDHRADMILLNGDTADAHAVSHWQTDPRERRFAEEHKAVVGFLELLREVFPKARIIYKQGNHEERYLRYMQVKAPEFLGIEAFDFKTLFALDRLGIEYVDGQDLIRVGHLNFLHGHEYRFAISNPVNPARGLFLRAKSHTVCGHFHQSSQHSERTLEDKTVTTWSTGCLCDLHPLYRSLNNWNHGFSFVQIDSVGRFEVSNLRIIGGKVY